MQRKKLFLFFAISAFLLTNIQPIFAKEPSKSFPRLVFFYSQSCHACHKARIEVMPEIEKEFFDKIIIDYLDIGDMNNFKLMLSLKEKYNSFENGVPTIFIEGKILVGLDNVKDKLRNTILEVLKIGKIEKLDMLPGVDLVKKFLSFGALAIITAGLIDGVNPCAFTVIVFFISFLALQGYRKKELIVIGFSFIFAVFLTYVCIGLGIFRFLYSISKFYLIAKIIYYLIAVFCFVIGILALYDLWLFKKSGKTEGMALQLPKIIKDRIHAVIGEHYRKSKEEKARPSAQRSFIRLIASAFITGFLISLLEAVCTGQLYLPTIAFILKETSLKLRAWAFLLLYNLMFIVPLIVVLLFALLGVTSETFAQFIKKHMLAVKLSMAILFLGLGFLILIGA